MRLTFAPRGRIQIDDAIIIYRNFSGIGSKYNREGDRNFAVLIQDQDIADQLVEAGWNVKIKPPHKDGDEPFMYLPVKIKFNDRGPTAYLVTGNKQVRMSEDTVGCFDRMDILAVNLDIRPYDWEVNGAVGRTAYLEGIEVFQDVDRFAAKYAEEEYPGEAPWN